MDVVITPAREEDVPVILEIMKTANMHYVPSPEMPELDWKCFFVAKIDGRIVGAAGYKIISKTEAKTTLMAIHPDFRKYGIGRALQARRMLALCERGIQTLITNADIPETIGWYKKHFGYKEIGKLKKLHEFGRPDIDEWTTLQTDLVEWKKNYGFDTEDPHPLKPYIKLIINTAITGMVPTKKDTPFVPVTVDEIITDAIKCVSAGASILHIHARDKDEKPTYKAEVFAEIIEGIRRECPGVIICVTTSGRTCNEFEKRSEVLDLDGFVKPDMASLTLGSLNFPTQASVNEPSMIMKLAEKIMRKGIKPELEIFDTGMVNTAKYLCRKGYINPPFYFNIILGSIYSTQAKMSDLSYLVNLLPTDTIWAGGGIGIFQLVVNTAAIIMGGHVRVGIEDNIWYDYGKKELSTNERSIQRLRRIACELGREIATPAEAREMLGLNMPVVTPQTPF